MVIEWVSISIQTALIAAIMAAFLLIIRLRMVKWVSLGFGRMMKTLTKDAEAEGNPSSPGKSPSGAISLGGFSIDINTIGQLAALAKELGLFKGGSGGGSGW